VKALLRLSIALLVLLLVAQLLGFREDVAVLSGSPGSPERAVSGVIYAALYFSCVLGVPIALMASALVWVFGRVTRKAEAAKVGD
jgi:hypothetical protein